MSDGIGSIAATARVLWSGLGFAELAVGLVVCLVLIAFALPARRRADEDAADLAAERRG